jgi:hypothetical protein
MMNARRLLVIAGGHLRIERRDPRLARRPRPAPVSIFRDAGLQAALVLVGASIADALVAVRLRKEKPEADAACRVGGRGIDALRARNCRAEIDDVLEGCARDLRVCRRRLHDAEERGGSMSASK